MNKKGAEMTIGTIIAITLGIALLVFLIFGFSTGWGNFWSTVSNIGGGSNVDDIVRGCEVACSTNANHAYCTETRTLKLGGDDEDIPDVTCNSLTKSHPEFGISCDMTCAAA